MKKGFCFLTSLFGLVFLFAACSHDLRVKNVHQYSARMPYLETPITIGLNTSASGVSEEFFNYFLDECYGIGNVKAIYPYAYSTTKPVDYMVEVNPAVDYGGSGANFIVSFPGFLIFTPAWHGYNYKADIYTDVTVTDYNTREVVFRERIHNKYKCAQAEFDRTWTTGTDWLLTLGVCSLIGGCYFTSYDDDITQEFNNTLSRPYGNYM